MKNWKVAAAVLAAGCMMLSGMTAVFADETEAVDFGAVEPKLSKLPVRCVKDY